MNKDIKITNKTTNFELIFRKGRTNPLEIRSKSKIKFLINLLDEFLV